MKRGADTHGKKTGDTRRFQIAYILVRQRYRNSVKNANSPLEADSDSDHKLVVMRGWLS